MSSSSELRAKKREVEKKKKKYEKRLKEVKGVYSDLWSDFSGKIEAVNKKITNVIEEQNSGFYNYSHFVNTLETELEDLKEAYVGDDTKMDGVASDLSQEISDIEDTIDELEEEIEQLERDIEEAEEEEEREREEAIKNFFGL